MHWISWDQNQCSPLGSYSLLQLQLLGIALHTLCTCLHFAKSDNVLCNNSLHPAAELLTALQCDHKSCIALRRAATRHLSSTGTWNDTFHLLVPPYSSTGSWNDRYCTPRFHSLACAEVRSCNFGSSVNPRLPSTPLSPSSSSQFLMCIFNLCIFNQRYLFTMSALWTIQDQNQHLCNLSDGEIKDGYYTVRYSYSRPPKDV